MAIKLIIAGSRTFDDPVYMKKWLYYILKDEEIEEVITGGQVSEDYITKRKYSADYWGGEWAKERGYTLFENKAKWKELGKSAGPIRNEENAVRAKLNGVCVVFWDGISRGSSDMIKRAKKHGLKVYVIEYLKEEFKLAA